MGLENFGGILTSVLAREGKPVGGDLPGVISATTAHDLQLPRFQGPSGTRETQGNQTPALREVSGFRPNPTQR